MQIKVKPCCSTHLDLTAKLSYLSCFDLVSNADMLALRAPPHVWVSSKFPPLLISQKSSLSVGEICWFVKKFLLSPYPFWFPVSLPSSNGAQFLLNGVSAYLPQNIIWILSNCVWGRLHERTFLFSWMICKSVHICIHHFSGLLLLFWYTSTKKYIHPSIVPRPLPVFQCWGAWGRGYIHLIIYSKKHTRPLAQHIHISCTLWLSSNFCVY